MCPKDVAENEASIFGDVRKDIFITSVLRAVVDVLDGVVTDGTSAIKTEELDTSPRHREDYLWEFPLGFVHGLYTDCERGHGGGGGGKEREGEKKFESRNYANNAILVM